ncbi:MAG: DUF1289 domain-containing protein [Alphaproteobacteria bacterium]|nr:DUF1289 domain-containing protein [Alphaproteobacteria bacterium]MBN9557343.1 DUF1289 domain-containing protein [Alphaproteobacteria bacterium]MBN9566479.1 DUF1289 domain-containing protein [Alphaproteobacteria bacterium]MBN9569751.1 DUF1289 domain-containing protein [Alphaproteobacteria bacterium]MBN9578793.1 DUF1289 domain-containing protein [Alphaproteobacteria bacterium]
MKSPCINVCVMAPASGLCTGCGRTLDEIARWGGMNDGERTAIMAALPARLKTLAQKALAQKTLAPKKDGALR